MHAARHWSNGVTAIGLPANVLPATALAAALALSFAAAAVAQSSSGKPLRLTINPGTIQLPVIPQGNYLDPGPGPAIRPDVSIGRGENNDYVFPPDLSGGYGSGPPGDPTNNGSWSPLDGDTPSF